MTPTAHSGETPPPGGKSPLFLSTRWSVVLAARERGAPEAARALGELCQTYWYPLYAAVRRAGYSPPDAEDMTQAFFERLLEKEWLVAADRTRGRFRSFLLTALKHFLANEWDKSRAAKRGGRVEIISIDAPGGEERLKRELEAPAEAWEPGFDRSWALALLDGVLGRLRREYEAAGKGEWFEQLKGSLGTNPSERPYARISRELGLSEGAARVAVHRMRQRYRQLLRDEIAQTVDTPEEIEDELRYLFAALTR